MSLSFVVICEAPADRRTACDLADRVFVDEVDWLEEDILEHNRRWRGFSTNDPHLLWRDVPDLARQFNVRAVGHFDGQPGDLDAKAARRALRLLMLRGDEFDGIVLVRDTDNLPARRAGLEQARNSPPLDVPVVIALAHTKRECWAIEGFDPRSPEEEAQLTQVRQVIGRDPRMNSHQLTAKHDEDDRSAKTILRGLCQVHDNPGREAECWNRTDLATLRDRGRQNGLADYLSEVGDRLVPLFRSVGA